MDCMIGTSNKSICTTLERHLYLRILQDFIFKIIVFMNEKQKKIYSHMHNHILYFVSCIGLQLI